MTECNRLQTLRNKMVDDAQHNILPFWLAAKDTRSGGFLGAMTTKGEILWDSPKSLVLNARLLWSFSSAYRVFGKAEYLQAAELAFDELTRYFWDAKNGGGYFLLNADRSVNNPYKMTYGQGFLLYAFSEYYRAAKRPEALAWAGKAFDYLETNCRQGSSYREFVGAPPKRPSSDDAKKPAFHFTEDTRSMNTHLHILEPVTNYFRIRHTATVEESLVNLIEVVTTKIYNAETRHCDLFFDKNMTPLSTDVSFGHDIESSWLIYEAADTLRRYAQDTPRADRLMERCRKIAIDMAEAVLGEGLDPATGAVYSEGDKDYNIIGTQKVWWAQAEGIVGFINAWQLTKDLKFLGAAERLWAYIDQYVINHNGHGWFATGTDSVPDENTGYLINPWKCPYHNTRAALEIEERTNAIEGAAPANT